MRVLEVRRHSFTKKDSGRGRGSHLSLEGVRRARQLGAELGAFQGVFTSLIPRTLETALAMGHAVTDCLEVLGDLPADFYEQIGRHERWSSERPLLKFRELLAKEGPARRMGLALRETWLTIARELPDPGAALIISHGNLIELGLVATVADQDFAEECPFTHLEGVRLAFDGTSFALPEFLRLRVSR